MNGLSLRSGPGDVSQRPRPTDTNADAAHFIVSRMPVRRSSVESVCESLTVSRASFATTPHSGRVDRVPPSPLGMRPRFPTLEGGSPQNRRLPPALEPAFDAADHLQRFTRALGSAATPGASGHAKDANGAGSNGADAAIAVDGGRGARDSAAAAGDGASDSFSFPSLERLASKSSMRKVRFDAAQVLCALPCPTFHRAASPCTAPGPCLVFVLRDRGGGGLPLGSPHARIFVTAFSIACALSKAPMALVAAPYHYHRSYGSANIVYPSTIAPNQFSQVGACSDWASRTWQHAEACGGRPERGGGLRSKNRKSTTPAATSTTPSTPTTGLH